MAAYFPGRFLGAVKGGDVIRKHIGIDQPVEPVHEAFDRIQNGGGLVEIFNTKMVVGKLLELFAVQIDLILIHLVGPD